MFDSWYEQFGKFTFLIGSDLGPLGSGPEYKSVALILMVQGIP